MKQKKSPAFTELSVMQKMGVEPTRYCYHTDLNRARLPIPPLLHLCVAIFSSNVDDYIVKHIVCQQ